MFRFILEAGAGLLNASGIAPDISRVALWKLLGSQSLLHFDVVCLQKNLPQAGVSHYTELNGQAARAIEHHCIVHGLSQSHPIMCYNQGEEIEGDLVFPCHS